MITYLMKKYALSRNGAVGMIQGVVSHAVTDIALMLPVGILYMLVAQLLPAAAATGEPVRAHSAGFFAVAGAAVLAVLFILNYIQYNATYFSTYKESAHRRISLAEKLRTLPLAFFGKKDLSDLTSSIMADCTTLETAFSHWYPALFGSIITTVIIAVSLFFFNAKMALAALWVLPVSFAIVFFTRRAQNWMSQKEMDAKMSCADGIQECIETVRDLKANNAEEKYLAGLRKKIQDVETGAVKNEFFMAIFVISAQLILKLGIGTVAVTGGTLLLNGEISVLTFFMFLLVVSRMYDPLGTALQNLAALNSTNINIGRMNEIENYPVQSGGKSFAPDGYDIEFKNVEFGYGTTDETVLRGISFTAKQGEVTALIGPSGGGKSTVSKLAARFWDADKGVITVGGVPVNSVDPETLLSCYSIVFQDVTLFNNTVMENIRIGKRGATDEEVIKAAKDAQCDDFVRNLSDGYNTVIGENGSALSGGERQRISIARALLKNAPVILLDEATAALDTENETKIQTAISHLVKNKTVLIIAHRMRTVAGADKLVFIKDGVATEQGNPQELLANGGAYARMVELQNGKQPQ